MYTHTDTLYTHTDTHTHTHTHTHPHTDTHTLIHTHIMTHTHTHKHALYTHTRIPRTQDVNPTTLSVNNPGVGAKILFMIAEGCMLIVLVIMIEELTPLIQVGVPLILTTHPALPFPFSTPPSHPSRPPHPITAAHSGAVPLILGTHNKQ